MKKKIFLAASATFFVSGALASDVVPNHIRHPLHTAAVKMLAPKSVVRMGATAATAASATAPAPTLAPGGLSNANIIAGLSWSALLGDTATYADNSVQQADIGATVAGLDGSGNVTASVNNQTTIVQNGFFRTHGLPLDYGYSERDYKATFFDNLGDSYSPPDLIEFGGHVPYDSAYLSVMGDTYGEGDDAAVVMSVQNNQSSKFGSRVDAAGTDSITLYAMQVGNPPRVKIVQNEADIDGVTHTLTFGVSSVVISPALSSDEEKLLKPFMRIYANYKTGNTCPYGNCETDLTVPNVYYGYISSVTDSSSSTTLTVVTDNASQVPGWRTEVDGSPAAAAPGSNSGDVIDNIAVSGGVWFNHANPGIFIGMSEHGFIENPSTFINGTTDDSVAREGTGSEYDENLISDHDFQKAWQGIAMGSIKTGNYRLAAHSFDAFLGGPTPILLGLGGYPEAIEVKGNNFVAGPVGFGTPGVVSGVDPTAANYRHLMAGFHQYSGPNVPASTTTTQGLPSASGNLDSLIVYQERVNAGSGNNAEDVSLNIAQQWNPGTIASPYGEGGVAPSDLAHIAFYYGGVSLCGQNEGQGEANLCGLSVPSNGNAITAPNGLTTTKNLEADGSITANGQMSALNSLVMRGVEYLQTNDGNNQIILVPGTNSVTFTPVSSSTAGSAVFNVDETVNGKLTANNDVNLTGSLSAAGNVTVGGHGGTTALNDPITAASSLAVSGKMSALNDFVMRGVQYLQTTDGTNQVLLEPGTNSITFTPVSSSDPASAVFNMDAVVNGKITASKDVSTAGSLTVSGNVTIGGNGGTTTLKDNVVLPSLAGTGNAYACLNASGQIYRSATACN